MGIKVRLTVAVSSVAVATALTGALGATPAASTSSAPGAVTTTSSPATTTTTPDRYTAGRYIVTFADEPVGQLRAATRRASAATRPRPGQKLDPASTGGAEVARSPDRQARRGTGQGRCHARSTTTRSPTTASPLSLTGPAGRRAGQDPGRRRPRARTRSPGSTPRTPRTSSASTPRGGIWSQLRRTGQRRRRRRRRRHRQRHLAREHRLRRRDQASRVPADWHGECVAGEQFDRNLCVQRQADRRSVLRRRLRQAEHRQGGVPVPSRRFRPRFAHRLDGGRQPRYDRIGSTATLIGTGSGMAPGAKVAAYKVCWEGKPGIDRRLLQLRQRRRDQRRGPRRRRRPQLLDRRQLRVDRPGLGGAGVPRRRPTLGVFVANSAGNSGPGASTLDHPAPWVTTVAAATFRRAFQAVELGNGARYVGASTTPPLTDADAARHGGEREARRRSRRSSRRSASPARSTRRRSPARSWSATAASTHASTRASRSSAPAVSAWCW